MRKKIENFPFLVVNFSIYLNRRVFVMDCANAQAGLNLRWAHISEGMFFFLFFTLRLIF